MWRVTCFQVAVALWVHREGVGMLWTNYNEVSHPQLIAHLTESQHVTRSMAGAHVCRPHLRPNGHDRSEAHKVGALHFL